MILIRDMKAESEKEGPIEFSKNHNLTNLKSFRQLFFSLFKFNPKWPTFIQKRAKLVLFSILSTKTVINNYF